MIEDNIINKEANERTVLVGLVTLRQSEAKVKEYLDELDFLARTAGLNRRNGSYKIGISQPAHLCRERET